MLPAGGCSRHLRLGVGPGEGSVAGVVVIAGGGCVNLVLERDGKIKVPERRVVVLRKQVGCDWCKTLCRERVFEPLVAEYRLAELE